MPGAGILTEKISGPAVSPGGMVTGQIDTCITFVEVSNNVNKFGMGEGVALSL